MKGIFPSIVLLLGLLLSPMALTAQDYFFPERNQAWKAAEKNQFKYDAQQLNTAVDFAKDNEYSGPRDLRQAILKGFQREPFHEILGPTKKRGGPAGMILKNGHLLTSWGDTQRVDMTFSVTKSFLSTVAGLAEDQGLIQNVDDKVSRYVWDGTFNGEHNSKITWGHLLQQNSDWSGELWGIKDWADRPPREGGLDDWKFRKLNEPGTVMEYNDVRVNVLAYSLTQVWRKPMPLVLKEELMDKIGASTTWRWYGYDHAWTVIDGLKMKSVTGGGHSGAGIFISTEDMARFGMVFLNNGKWKDQQLISEEWIAKATEPSVPNASYGYMWWLNQKDGTREWEGVPDHVFYAAGFGGNFIVVDQKNGLLIVTRWLEPSKIGEFVKQVYQAF
ncbi:serine hydrolase domain-containing protein [Flagellimonas nanhaiensis]|uniref:Class C beta-lactamase-related serine hydrolase n=1 Tax=Flagellimonas nanhaiensis TaxID=2292706 RepID=A0A371JRI3_9FLAO|nr:serine hydrolase [Allomuricauda nanhaiensis]RDY60120.1 class C beta-lactamase-related serine hydrolase [Allomuricauda nanhaiensis]